MPIQAVKVPCREPRVVLEAARLLLEAVRVFIQAVKMLVQVMKVLKKARVLLKDIKLLVEAVEVLIYSKLLTFAKTKRNKLVIFKMERKNEREQNKDRKRKQWIVEKNESDKKYLAEVALYLAQQK